MKSDGSTAPHVRVEMVRRLARLIMDELTASAPNWVVDSGDAWSAQDLDDVKRASLDCQLHRPDLAENIITP